MKRRRFLKTALVSAASLSASPLPLGSPTETDRVQWGDLKATLGANGNPVHIQSGAGGAQRIWLNSTPTLTVSNEITGVSDSPLGRKIKALDLAVSSK
jgi:hypothetical protein